MECSFLSEILNISAILNKIKMFSELWLKGIPSGKASEKLKSSIKKEIEMENFMIVKGQKSNKEEILLIRFFGKKDHLIGRIFKYKKWDITLTDPKSQLNEAINYFQKTLEKADSLGVEKPGLKDLARVFISDIPDNTHEEELDEELSRFGAIWKTEILRRSNQHLREKLTCDVAIVYYDRLDQAIWAYYKNKINFKGKELKIIFNLEIEKLKNYLGITFQKMKIAERNRNIYLNMKKKYKLNSLKKSFEDEQNYDLYFQNKKKKISKIDDILLTDSRDEKGKINFEKILLKTKPKRKTIKLRSDFFIEVDYETQINNSNIRMNYGYFFKATDKCKIASYKKNTPIY